MMMKNLWLLMLLGIFAVAPLGCEGEVEVGEPQRDVFEIEIDPPD